jgi:hypothetical protein
VAAVPNPFDQLYEVAPLAVKLVQLPAQTVAEVGVTETPGAVLIKLKLAGAARLPQLSATEEQVLTSDIV